MNIITKNARKVAQGTAVAVMALTALAPIAANADDWRSTGPTGPSWNYQHDRHGDRSGQDNRDYRNDSGYRSRDNQNRWDYRNDNDDRDSRWNNRNNRDSGWQNRRSQDDSRQNDKNNMRNLAIGAGAIAAYGLLNHNNLATILGAAGAAVAGSQYEKDRKAQSQDNNDWRNRDDRRYHRSW